MHAKNLFFLIIYIINIINIYSFELIENEINFNITEIYTYDNITDYTNNSIHLSQYNESQIMKKTEILKNNNGLNYLCKDDICTKIDIKNWKLSFVEIPDKNKNIKIYIKKSYTYNKIKSHKYPNYSIDHIENCTKEERDNFGFCKYYALISFKCTSDSQCLTNKCIDGYCMFNKENPTEFCTSIYSYSIFLGSHSYMHCGKATGDICETNEECASINCSKYGHCKSPSKGPSDTDGLREIAQLFCLVCMIIIFFMVFIVSKYIINFIKENKNIDKIK